MLLAALALLALQLGACTEYNPNPDEFVSATTTNADFTLRDIVVGNLPSALDVADADNDGDLDLAVANSLSLNVQLLRNDGGLNFSSTTIPLGVEPSKVLFADLDGGGVGQLDLVAYAVNQRTLLLLSNNGAAWQTQGLVFADVAHSLAAVDLNGYGSAADLVLTFPATGNLRVLLNNDGTGGFTTLTTVLCAGASAFHAGNFSADSNIDLAVLCYTGNTVRILLGDGTGVFTEQPAGGLALGGGPKSIAAADFNGDLSLDLAIANTLGSTVTVLLGDGAGGFTASHIGVSGSPEWLSIGRFDGVNDSIAVNHDGLNVLTVLLGNGLGGFTSVQIPVSEDPYALAVGDFSGSTALDLLSLERVERVASVLLGNGGGAFSRSVIGFQDLPARPRVVGGGFDGGGKDDLLLLQPSLDRVTILENRN